jgi:arylsulfatase A-like enzyme
MSLEPSQLPRREPLGRSLARAAAFAALGGAAIGLAEAAKMLTWGDARYAQWACKVVAFGAIGSSALAAALAIPCALLASAVFGRPNHRAAPPSICAALGALSATAAFVLLRLDRFELALAAAIAATAGVLAVRELLAWWTFATRASTWWALLGLALSACVALVARSWAEGLVQGVAYVLAAANALVAGRAFLGKNAPHAATLGVVGLAVLAFASGPEHRRPEASPAKTCDVLLLTIDTLRADHLGCYGSKTAKTPVIDRLASEGVVFEDATSQANTTVPSHTTILTGLYPAEHGAISNGVKLTRGTKTLADALRRTHSTAAFVSGFTLIDEACGLAPRFDWYEDQLTPLPWLPRTAERLRVIQGLFRIARHMGWTQRSYDRPAPQTADAALEWLASRGDEPLFTWMHLFDPHAPYEPPREYAELHGVEPERGGQWYELKTRERDALASDPAAVARIRALYEAEISCADAQVGRVLQALKDSGRYDRTLIVLAADHGESLGAHGVWFDHGYQLYEDELHVPLIVRFPGGAHSGTRVARQVRLLDIVPTVLDVVGQPGALPSSGASLVDLASGRSDDRERASYAVSDISGNLSGFDIDGRRLSLRAAGRKLIWSSSHWLDTVRVDEQEQAFDLARDPLELDDLRGREPDASLDTLWKQLHAWRDATATMSRERKVDDELLENLRKLGYL